MMHEKISGHHLERKAILYIRQSSTYQVLHTAKVALQYAMRDRLKELGWSQIQTVDEDLGRSAAGGLTRAGSTGWSPRSALERLGRVRHERYRALLATTVIGNSSRCAASSTLF